MKIFLQKVTLQIGLNKFLIKSITDTIPWTYLIEDVKDEEIVGTVQMNLKKKKKRNRKKLNK